MKYEYKKTNKCKKLINIKQVDCLSWSKLMSICFSSNSTPEDFSISILEEEKIIVRIIRLLEGDKIIFIIYVPSKATCEPLAETRRQTQGFVTSSERPPRYFQFPLISSSASGRQFV